MGDVVLSILHGGDGGWQQRALLQWLLFGEYGLTYFSTHITPFLLLLHNIGMILRSNKANKAKNEGMSILYLLYETWDEEILCEMRLFLCEKKNFILCISCIDDDVGQLIVVTWYFLENEGHLTT